MSTAMRDNEGRYEAKQGFAGLRRLRGCRRLGRSALAR